MKLLDIAYKDLLRAFRSFFFWAFALGVPLLTSAIFYFAFGSLTSGSSEALKLPVTEVQVVNLDTPAAQAGGFSAGQLLADFLASDSLKSLLHVTGATDPAAARAAVDRQAAAVAVIIPAGFTAAMSSPDQQAAVELYQDPTLSLGPSIVKGLVSQFIDGLAGSRIAAAVAAGQMAASGIGVDAQTAQAVALQYGEWASRQQGASALVDVRAPAAAQPGSANMTAQVVSLVMAGMMVLYVFFTGASSAQTLLQEEEAGTLPRLFTTPTAHSAILGGRLLATLVALVVQVAVLLVASALLFGVRWGQPGGVVLTALGMILVAGSFGLFITSLLKNTRQAGIVYGGVMTMMGMIGMLNTFTAGAPAASRGNLDLVARAVPQGWAVHAWELLLSGGTVADVLPTVLVVLGLAAVFFAAGVLRFRRRYA